jgi:hypothetical protein
MSNSYEVLGDYLQRHAYENVWCTPDQDRQTIFKPARLTVNGGVWKDTKVMWEKMKLPDSTSRFHVYQIGQVYPPILGLGAKQNEWINLAQACNTNSMIADIYTVKGVQIHRNQVWYRVTEQKNLILAIRLPMFSRIQIDLNAEDIYMRLYSNAYFNSLRANGVDEIVHVQGTVIASTEDILNFQNVLDQWKAKTSGVTYCFNNGLIVDSIDLITTRIGDYVEFVYDGSIKRIVEFSVSSLNEFVSVLDSVHKYLLHYAGSSDVIDYHDDVDFFLCLPQPGNRFKGVYYHKNNPTAVRMVTHKDYSVPVQYLASYAQNLPELGGDVDALKIRLHIRESGYLRPLVREHNRIQELYLLEDQDIVDAMVGVDSVVSVWSAAALENSDYCKLMRSELGQITREMVQNAYGYNAVSKLIGDTPKATRLEGTLQVVDVPAGLHYCATAYEYDQDGFLLGWRHHQGGAIYAAQDSRCRMVELIFGFANENLDAVWNQATHVIDPSFSHRYYTCGFLAGTIDHQWVDETAGARYALINNRVTWLTDPDQRFTLVRSNKNHLCYSFSFMAIDSLIRFSIREFRADIGAYRVMTLPMGEMDVFLNRKKLIEGLDYIVDYPAVTLLNKEYLVDPENQAQEIVVRFSNFCDSELKRTPVPDVGFVQYGVLSFNNRYDIRDDKVNHVVVDGAVYRYDELNFAEEDFEIGITDARNGAPYAIRDIVVPMNNYLYASDEKTDRTYTLRKRSMDVDKEISDYMTLKIPQKDPTPPSAIPGRYQVVSPFFSKIIYDLRSGALWDEKLFEQYNDNFIMELLQPYLYLLKYDPTTDPIAPDPLFVVVHPHNLNSYLSLGVYEYKFLVRVNRLFGNGRIDLSAHVSVEEFGLAPV